MGGLPSSVEVPQRHSSRRGEVTYSVSHFGSHRLLCRKPHVVAIEIVPATVRELQMFPQNGFGSLVVNDESVRPMGPVFGCPGTSEYGAVDHENRCLAGQSVLGAQVGNHASGLNSASIV